MRSRKSLFLVTAVLLLVPAAAFASGGWMIDARGGVGLPMGNYKDDFKSGLLLGVEASKMMSPQFAIGVDGNYVKNNVTDSNRLLLEQTFGAGTDANTKFTHYGVHAKYMMSTKEGAKVAPYLVGGGGLYHIKESITNSGTSVDTSENKFGLRGGIGMNWMMSEKMGLGFQADYNDVMTSGSSTQFIGLSAGLHWMLTPASSK
jgi:outer membrane autotransporter protein